MDIKSLGEKAKSLLSNLVRPATQAYFNVEKKVSPAFFQIKDRLEKLPTSLNYTPSQIDSWIDSRKSPLIKYPLKALDALFVDHSGNGFGSPRYNQITQKVAQSGYKSLSDQERKDFIDSGINMAMGISSPVKAKENLIPKNIIGTLEQKLSKNIKPLVTNGIDDASVYVQKALDAKLPAGMKNHVAEVVANLKNMSKDKNIMQGLMNESPAQTAFRRSQNIKPADLYTAPVDAVKTGLNKAKGFVVEMEKEFEKHVDIPVEKRVNVFDYLRTPQAVFEKIGLKDEGKMVSNAWTKYKMELPQELNKITEWYKRTPDPKSSERIFDFLDGSLTADKLLPNEHSVALEMKDYLKSWAYKLGLPEDKQISSYISHIFPKGEVEQGFSPEVARLIDTKMPRAVYDRFLQKRTGTDPERYIHDAFLAIDAYTKTAVRKLNMDPALKRVEEASKNLDNESFKYVQSKLANVNLRPEHIDNLVDNFIKSTPIGYKLTARPTAYVTSKIRGATYKGALGLNVGSALRNTSQLANNYALLGEKKFGQGVIDLVRKGSKELVDNGVLVDNFIEDRNLNTTKQFLKKVDDGLFYLFQGAEKLNRGVGYFGAKRQAIEKGLSESDAVKYAVDFVKKTQFSFGPMDMPVVLQGDMAKTILQFQSFNLKQGEFLINLAKDKNWGALARYTLSSLLFVGSVGQMFGMNYADIIPFSGVFTGQTKIGQTPVVQAIGATSKLAFGDEETKAQGWADLKKAGTTFFPAGVQIKKTLDGLNLVNKGANFSAGGRVRYSAPDGLMGKAQALIFGPNSTANAKDYFDNKRTALGENQTTQYQSLIKAGFTPSEAMKGFRDAQARTKEKTQIEEALKSGKVTLESNSDLEPLQRYFDLDVVSNMPEDNMYSKAKKQQTIFSKISEVLDNEILNDEQKTQVLESVGIPRKYGDYYNIAKESPEVRTAYIMDQMSQIKSLNDLVKFRTEINGKTILTSEVLNNLVGQGLLDSSSASLLKKLTIRDGKVITAKSGTGTKRKLPTFKRPALIKQKSVVAPRVGMTKLRSTSPTGNFRANPIKVQPMQINFDNSNPVSNMMRLKI